MWRWVWSILTSNLGQRLVDGIAGAIIFFGKFSWLRQAVIIRAPRGYFAECNLLPAHLIIRALGGNLGFDLYLLDLLRGGLLLFASSRKSGDGKEKDRGCFTAHHGLFV